MLAFPAMATPPQIPQNVGTPLDALRAGIDRHAQVINAAKTAGAQVAATPPATSTSEPS